MGSFLIVMLNDRGSGDIHCCITSESEPVGHAPLGQRVVVVILLSQGDAQNALEEAWASQALAHPAAVVPSL